MAVVRRCGDRLLLWCPGCEDVHQISIGADGWTWDGNESAPTINPSIKVSGVQWAPDSPFHRFTHDVAPGGEITCHSFVRAGQWEFLTDSTHRLAGRIVPVEALPDWLTDR